jgi:acetyltransferase-like isoleucine patch superfamily enzyme
MFSPLVARILRRLKNSIIDREVSRAIEQIEATRRPAGSRSPPDAGTLTVVDYGSANVLKIDTAAKPKIRGAVVFKGSNNQVQIGASCHGPSVHFELGSDARVQIDDDCRLSNLFIYCLKGGSVQIGAGSSFEAEVRLQLHEPGRIVIGRDCLFSTNIDVSISDMHSIVSETTGARLNPPADIVLDDHVWIGTRAMILKGSHVGRGSIVGACSVVTGAIEENCVAAGAPAKVKRKGVTWRIELLPVNSQGLPENRGSPSLQYKF